MSSDIDLDNSGVSIPSAVAVRDTASKAVHVCFADEAQLSLSMRLGVFYLKVPDWFQMSYACQFCANLAKVDNPYRGVPRLGALEGFISLENNQQTKLALRRDHWREYYPPSIVELGERFDEIGAAIIRAVLGHTGIPEEKWDWCSGGYSSGDGESFLNFVYYDSDKANWGLRAHADYGLITILFATSPGLEVKVDGEFVEVPVRPGYFIVNFGEALRFVTEFSSRPVEAVVHRVRRQRISESLRYSIVYFGNPRLDRTLVQIDSDSGVHGQSTVEALFSRLESDLTE